MGTVLTYTYTRQHMAASAVLLLLGIFSPGLCSLFASLPHNGASTKNYNPGQKGRSLQLAGPNNLVLQEVVPVKISYQKETAAIITNTVGDRLKRPQKSYSRKVLVRKRKG